MNAFIADLHNLSVIIISFVFFDFLNDWRIIGVIWNSWGDFVKSSNSSRLMKFYAYLVRDIYTHSHTYLLEIF